MNKKGGILAYLFWMLIGLGLGLFFLGPFLCKLLFKCSCP